MRIFYYVLLITLIFLYRKCWFKWIFVTQIFIELVQYFNSHFYQYLYSYEIACVISEYREVILGVFYIVVLVSFSVTKRISILFTSLAVLIGSSDDIVSYLLFVGKDVQNYLVFEVNGVVFKSKLFLSMFIDSVLVLFNNFENLSLLKRRLMTVESKFLLAFSIFFLLKLLNIKFFAGEDLNYYYLNNKVIAVFQLIMFVMIWCINGRMETNKI